ncbi:MAG: hypothetical protein GSR78_02710 [Desulfurococcales archaeon]|nr:hypothetical protein [Desulfurococcales archaeon]
MFPFLLGFAAGVVAVIVGALVLSGVLQNLDMNLGLNYTLNNTAPWHGGDGEDAGPGYASIPWLFPGAYARYKAVGSSLVDEVHYNFTLMVNEIHSSKASLILSSEPMSWTFTVDLSSKEAIIESLALGIAGEPITNYHTDTYNTVFGERSVIIAKTDTKTLIIDEETLWPLAYIEVNPDMQAILAMEITKDTNIDFTSTG